MNTSKQMKRGQILVMVLITMMVLGIILISITTIQIKDQNITQTTSKYETLIAYAEKMAFQLGLEFANPQKNNFNISIFAEAEPETLSQNVNGLLSEIGWKTNDTCAAETTDSCYRCDIEFDESNLANFISATGDFEAQTSNPEDVKAIARICDSAEIRNAELFKDELLIFNLNGLEKNIVEDTDFQIDWKPNTKLTNVGIEISVDFVYTALGETNYGTVKSIFKAHSSNIFGLNLNPNNNSYLPFSEKGNTSFKFNLAELDERLNNDSNGGYFRHFQNSQVTDDLEIQGYKQLRIKPVIKADTPVAMNISILTDPDLENVQGRSIEVVVYEQSGEVAAEVSGGFRGPQASVISTVPAAKLSGLFDYVLKNENTLF